MELPHALRTTITTLPRDLPYLSVPAAPADLGRDRRPRIGLVWQAGDWDRRRSVPAGLMARIARLPRLRFLSLQRGRARSDLDLVGAEDASSDDVLRAAAVIQALDLLISVDTMAAHLAGALAAPVWTLLAAHSDWRWLEGRSDSPWYPTMRLFRQARPGDWDCVVARVAAALKERFG
jgi:Glycosyltransferase family 9 (heptosyltransferase)